LKITECFRLLSHQGEYKEDESVVENDWRFFKLVLGSVC